MISPEQQLRRGKPIVLLRRICQKVLEEQGLEDDIRGVTAIYLEASKEVYKTEMYRQLHRATSESDGIVLMQSLQLGDERPSLEKYNIVLRPDGSFEGALVDTVITFVSASGLLQNWVHRV